MTARSFDTTRTLHPGEQLVRLDQISEGSMRTSDGRPRGCVLRGLVIQYHAWHGGITSCPWAVAQIGAPGWVLHISCDWNYILEISSTSGSGQGSYVLALMFYAL